jgi:hypothetical protein
MRLRFIIAAGLLVATASVASASLVLLGVGGGGSALLCNLLNFSSACNSQYLGAQLW